MRSRRLLPIAALALIIAAACQRDSTTTQPSVTVVSVAVSGTAPPVGATATFTATATMSDGTTQNVSAQATWGTSNAAIATVSSAGVVTGVAAGDADIRATYQSFTGAKTITVVITQSSCRFTLSATTLSIGASGGASSLTVTPSADACTWTATSSSAFITVTAGASSTGTGTVAFTVSANTGAARSGVLTIAGQSVTVNQDAAAVSGNCVTSISPTSRNFGEEGPAQGTITVTAPSNCSWSASTTASFLSAGGPTSGTGNGTVVYIVASNPTNSGRTGTITIGGQTFTVTQDPRPCPVTVTPAHFDVDGAGCRFVGASCLTAFTVNVNMTGTCPWNSFTTDAWLGGNGTLSSGFGQGSGAVTLRIDQNNTGQTRNGSIAIAGQAVTVTQTACAFSLSPSTVTVGAAATSIQFTATSSGSCLYNFIRNTTFLGVGFQSIGYSGTNTITISVPENASTASRTETLQMYGRESNGATFPIVATATVTQSGKP